MERIHVIETKEMPLFEDRIDYFSRVIQPDRRDISKKPANATFGQQNLMNLTEIRCLFSSLQRIPAVCIDFCTHRRTVELQVGTGPIMLFWTTEPY